MIHFIRKGSPKYCLYITFIKTASVCFSNVVMEIAVHSCSLLLSHAYGDLLFDILKRRRLGTPDAFVRGMPAFRMQSLVLLFASLFCMSPTTTSLFNRGVQSVQLTIKLKSTHMCF